MLDHIGIALMMERFHGSRDQRPGAAEDEFYQSIGDSRLVHIAARLLSMPIAKGAHRWRAPFFAFGNRTPDQAALRMRPCAAAGAASMRNCLISAISASASLASCRLASVVSSTIEAFFWVI
jgi:hypothetical protein